MFIQESVQKHWLLALLVACIFRKLGQTFIVVQKSHDNTQHQNLSEIYFYHDIDRHSKHQSDEQLSLIST